MYDVAAVASYLSAHAVAALVALSARVTACVGLVLWEVGYGLPRGIPSHLAPVAALPPK